MALFVVHLTQLRGVTEYPILFDSCLFFLIDDLAFIAPFIFCYWI
ncbi:hypothetical protein VCNHCC008D_002143 [Vibrio cholerae O1 str. NHCC-008D]|nr:hypothetical protein VCNHCC008D_002143 [Vibrio cholerae O1 str. NHCC-008D]